MKTKKDCQKKHATKRALQRFGIKYNDNIKKSLVGLIQSNKAMFIERQSLRLTVWIVPLETGEAFAVYDSQRKEIATFIDRYGDMNVEQAKQFVAKRKSHALSTSCP